LAALGQQLPHRKRNNGGIETDFASGEIVQDGSQFAAMSRSIGGLLNQPDCAAKEGSFMLKYSVLTAAVITLAVPALANAQMVTANRPASVVEAMQTGGYKAAMGKDSTGDPRIESASSGATFFVNFYGCTGGKDCKTVTFYSGWDKDDVSLNQMNEWNKNKRFSRAYIDKDGDPVLEFDVDLDDGGMSQALFIDNVEFFEAAIGGFKTHIGL
jgi:hypothetical protein